MTSDEPYEEGILNYSDLTPADQAVIDQNAAAANDRVDYLVQRMAEHLMVHPGCPGVWCVSDLFADAIMDFTHEQSNMLVTIMARRLVKDS